MTGGSRRRHASPGCSNVLTGIGCPPNGIPRRPQARPLWYGEVRAGMGDSCNSVICYGRFGRIVSDSGWTRFAAAYRPLSSDERSTYSISRLVRKAVSLEISAWRRCASVAASQTGGNGRRRGSGDSRRALLRKFAPANSEQPAVAPSTGIATGTPRKWRAWRSGWRISAAKSLGFSL